MTAYGQSLVAVDTGVILRKRRVLLLDTSVLLEIIRVPFKCDRHEQTVAQFESYVREGVQLRIPAAAVLETGGHVRRIVNGHDRRQCAGTFVKFLVKALDEEAPWSFVNFEWTDAVIRNMVDGAGHYYPLELSLANGTFEMGDLAIVEEWRRTHSNVAAKSYDGDVWTYDASLRAVVDTLRGPR